MLIVTQKIENDFHRDSHWTRIYLKSDDNQKQSVVLICASHEFLEDELKTNIYTQEQLTNWFEGVAANWSSKGESVFDKSVHYVVYAMSDEGYKNGEAFLRSEVVK